MTSNIEAFLAVRRIAVVGASRDTSKYGYRVFQHLRGHGYEVVPVNPRSPVIDGVQSVEDLYAVEPLPEAISIITPPAVSETVIETAITLNIRNIWLQPGAENVRCLELCHAAEIDVICGGPCVLLELP